MEDEGCINKVNQARTPHSYCANVFDPNTDPRRQDVGLSTAKVSNSFPELPRSPGHAVGFPS